MMLDLVVEARIKDTPYLVLEDCKGEDDHGDHGLFEYIQISAYPHTDAFFQFSLIQICAYK